MIALVCNWFEGDGNLVQEIVGIFNDESEIPEFYKRTTFSEDELWRYKPNYKRFLNSEEYEKFKENVLDGEYDYGYPGCYSLKEIEIGKIIEF